MNPIVVERYSVHDHGKPTERRVRMHYYWCPGCDALHGIAIRPDVNSIGAGWEFTGTLKCPTYAPSQLTHWDGLENGVEVRKVCHTFIREGRIEFLGDCTHAMRNQTVALPPLPDWVIRDGDDE